MELKKAFSALLLIMALTLVAAEGDKDRDLRTNAYDGQKSTRTWVNSPEVEFHPNGDRVSHYPPYYHPTQ